MARAVLVALGLLAAPACKDSQPPPADAIPTEEPAPTKALQDPPPAPPPGEGRAGPDQPAAADDEPAEEPSDDAEEAEEAANDEADEADDDAEGDDEGDEEDEGAGKAEHGQLLPGDKGLPIMKVSLVRGAPRSERIGEGGVMLDRLDATLSPTATVGEVNRALEKIGARVCKMDGPGIPYTVVLCIPPQKSVGAVQKLANRLAASSAVAAAQPVRGFKSNVIPP